MVVRGRLFWRRNGSWIERCFAKFTLSFSLFLLRPFFCSCLRVWTRPTGIRSPCYRCLKLSHGKSRRSKHVCSGGSTCNFVFRAKLTKFAATNFGQIVRTSSAVNSSRLSRRLEDAGQVLRQVEAIQVLRSFWKTIVRPFR